MAKAEHTDFDFERFRGKALALMGGSFDPFHNAHRALAESAVSRLPVEALILMPLGRAPHKKTRMLFSTFRYEMAARGVEGLLRVFVSDEEIRTPGVDYTFDTVSFLRARCDPREIYLVAGSDALDTMPTWSRYSELLSDVVLAVACRGEDDRERLGAKADEYRERNGARVVFFDMPRSSLSSSALRERLLSGGSVEGLCPDAVVSLIEKYRIYDFQNAYGSLSDEAWSGVLDTEEAVWSCYSRERRLHAVSVAQYAARLAAANGCDVRKALIAGFLHDAAKGAPPEEQRSLARRYLRGHPFSPRASAMIGSVAERGEPQKEREKNLWFLSLSDDILHGPAGAHLARNHFGISDADVLDAICFHSTARPGMSSLEKILYLADKIGYDRNFLRLGDIRERAIEGDLDGAMRRCLEETFIALRREHRVPHPLSVAAYRELVGD